MLTFGRNPLLSCGGKLPEARVTGTSDLLVQIGEAENHALIGALRKESKKIGHDVMCRRHQTA